MGENGEFALTLVLTAAVLHASWNAMVKGTGERLVVMGLIAFAHMLVGAATILSVPAPASASWPFIAASTIIHFFYYGFLLLSYRLGDLSQIYPVARGIAPLLVTLGAFFLAGEVLPPAGIAGILMVSFGILLLTFSRRLDRAGLAPIGAALLTGVIIAAYSVADGLGVRRAESALGYIGWLFFFEGYVFFYIMWRQRKKLGGLSVSIYGLGLLGGLFSAAAYGLVIYAKTLAPLGSISAVRESSVIIAALIGVIWLGERPWKLRVLSAAIVTTGILMLTLLT